LLFFLKNCFKLLFVIINAIGALVTIYCNIVAAISFAHYLRAVEQD